VARGPADLRRLEVGFPDKSLEAVVREALGKPDGRLTRADLESLEELEAYDRGIEDLTGLGGCVNLDLTPLNNSGDEVSLIDDQGIVRHQVAYPRSQPIAGGTGAAGRR